ncbi:MAG: shikimate dehydrogenase [Acidimicrobiia bacterium]|nr:shikimate dehydrogenase [Acidimicrobiia bacterium]
MIGSPIRHSLSPVIFNAAFAASGRDDVFLAFEVGEADVPAALAGARALGFLGLSVTMPDKEVAARAVDRLTPAAEALGAVNSVRVRPEGTLGHNTDGAGFVDALEADAGLRVAGARVGVVGAGGAARAVTVALADAGASEVVVVNRTRERAVTAAALASVARVGAVDELAGVDLLVNATSVGMAPGGDQLPVPVDVLDAGQVVCDVIYWPAETPLLRAARERGATTVGGLGMLVHQAGHSYRLWLDEEPPLDEMRRAAREALAARV